jgi:hypothetical protein
VAIAFRITHATSSSVSGTVSFNISVDTNAGSALLSSPEPVEDVLDEVVDDDDDDEEEEDKENEEDEDITAMAAVGRVSGTGDGGLTGVTVGVVVGSIVVDVIGVTLE